MSFGISRDKRRPLTAVGQNIAFLIPKFSAVSNAHGTVASAITHLIHSSSKVLILIFLNRFSNTLGTNLDIDSLILLLSLWSPASSPSVIDAIPNRFSPLLPSSSGRAAKTRSCIDSA